ncbi:4-hydroxyphenylacetate 3-monooxygenase, reductase component [Rhodococcus opacus]|uniref:4-hydroxyphenylacetate 3-monooxygenase reductase component n=1 Tax=Rhodococcus opacus TaxID=37919 RepID=A0AAX3YD91_RHOOP|nr:MULTISPECIES: 4-hydroxyphenylacetate 3-monooxygenase, reductase component [Rhodococcus]ELB86150.1 reductase, monooxygenase component [Rhodococcus wratislaviensis IFP 2016]MCZ4586829.1 4-hydroxyphenylacetate 3-monooxygenase, reductase component [Rhodococcus opacus]MDI9939604.1 4-hydroxyphenylacetate 3-monooxygenase, reductase component [Rhodococcus sp. IEGM 1351]MDJ0415914.1 4-hydroxyphenylacetate 3-monooxygenase, reductase component [Rhodococcus opacus]MDV6243432.1 4-hydroxyphenylacetate 3-
MPELTTMQSIFRTAMANLPAAVNIVTTDGPAGRCGMTVTAVCSVTDSPPTALVCVNQNSAMHNVFRNNGRVGINVLSGDDEELAMHFAGATQVAMADRFQWDIWEEDTDDGVPILRAAHVVLAGRIADSKTVGSHSVMFVELDRVQTREHGDSLVYFQRKFHRLSVPVESPDWLFYDEWSDPITVTPALVPAAAGGK